MEKFLTFVMMIFFVASLCCSEAWAKNPAQKVVGEMLLVDYQQPVVQPSSGCQEEILANDYKKSQHEKGKKVVEIRLFYFGKEMRVNRIEKKIDQQGFRPATARELLAFAKKNPNAQGRYPIVGLGMPQDRFNLVLILDWKPGCGRVIRQEMYRGQGSEGPSWGAGYRFLAVRKH